MNLIQNIQELSKNEKMIIMEYLWKDLFVENEMFESPEWHKTALAETEESLKEGKEEIIDWSDAKKQLRKNFE
ncbi:putative addiction module component [Desulfobotulus alkaliphilus]|uniref:Putative addiction module component n=1 Tax=Desulfobotulus alkaliphilus TaxID=622671 RepID=A0A562QUT7_9BACT|nr:addiction module protein [Desulfobotulus alkaliphilus]TWI60535.1 putative addiction module component [Desulfobotulus alkaliphilus]